MNVKSQNAVAIPFLFEENFEQFSIQKKIQESLDKIGFFEWHQK